VQHTERMRRFLETDLYLVITEEHCAGRPAGDVLAAALDAGVRLVQLREKHLDDRRLFARAQAFRRATSDAGALMIVDDRIDVAMACDADGVHLGRRDLPVVAARDMAPDMIIGASSHSLAEALEAQRAEASYVNIGPVFPTKTKAVPTGALGPGALDEIAPALSIPWTVMGGIRLENVGEVLGRGARHVAVVTAVTAAADVRRAAAELVRSIRTGRLETRPPSG